MKNKLIKLTAIALAVISVCACLCACTKEPSGNLCYDQKYITTDTRKMEESQQIYFIFHKDGTGAYHYYHKESYSIKPTAYTVYFDYSFVDKDEETVICTFRSSEADPDCYDISGNSANWMLLVSKQLVMNSKSGTTYFSESYFNDHPEFCKNTTAES